MLFRFSCFHIAKEKTKICLTDHISIFFFAYGLGKRKRILKYPVHIFYHEIENRQTKGRYIHGPLWHMIDSLLPIPATDMRPLATCWALTVTGRLQGSKTNCLQILSQIGQTHPADPKFKFAHKVLYRVAVGKIRWMIRLGDDLSLEKSCHFPRKIYVTLAF